MKIKRNKKISKNKKLVGAVVLIVIAGLAFVAYIYAQKREAPTNNTNTTQTTNSSNTNDKVVDDKPANQDVQPTPSKDANITITFSALGQDSPGGPLLVRTILEGASGGNCTVSATKNGVTKTYKPSVEFAGTYYSCNYTIPFADLSVGKWTVVVNVIDGSKKGELSNTVDIKS